MIPKVPKVNKLMNNAIKPPPATSRIMIPTKPTIILKNTLIILAKADAALPAPAFANLHFLLFLKHYQILL